MKGLLQSDRADQVLQGLQFLSAQLLRNECLTWLLPCWWHMASGLAEPPAAAVYLAGLPWGFFPSSQRRLVSEFCELLMPLHLEHLQPVCSFSAGRSPSRQVYPKSNPSIWKLLCHRQDSLEFPLPIPPMARSQRVSCPGIAAACWTPWCWGAITILWWTFLKPKIQPHDFGVFLLLIGSSFGWFPLQEAVI